VVVQVPSEAPDKTDTVIVLEMNGPVKGIKGRLLANNVVENQLLGFDGQAHGKFSYGDGKANRYYAAGFDKPSDSIGWPVRLNEAAVFQVSVRYLAPGDATLIVQAGEQTVMAQGQAAKAPQVLELGTLRLAAGEQELQFKLKEPAELSLFEVILRPAW